MNSCKAQNEDDYQMSIMCFISFPRALTKHQVSYIKLWGEDSFRINKDAKENWERMPPIVEGQVDGRFSVWDISVKTSFNNCFVNPFIYAFSTDIPDYYYEQQMEITSRYMGKETIVEYWDDDAMTQELCEYWSKEWYLRNEVLYKYLYDNLNVGDFVEIYESWIEEEDENGMIFGPPTSETVINLKELLSLPYPMKTIEFGEREKLSIHKP